MEKIIERYLGIKEPKIIGLDTGEQNRTYKINDKYILKIFSDDVIKNEYEREIRETKESIAQIAKENGIESVLPYKFNGRYIQKNKMYFCIYPYIPYKSINKDQLLIEHVSQIARILRKLHKLEIDVALPNISKTKIYIDFEKYVYFHRNNLEMRTLLMKNKEKLEKLINRINLAIEKLKDKIVITHNDLCPENVLWDKFQPYILDWDSACYANHMCVVNECAYEWCTNKGELNIEFYKTFMSIYLSKNECMDNIYDVIYATLYTKFISLYQCLERTMNEDNEKVNRSKEEFKTLLHHIETYEKNIPIMVSILNMMDNKYEDDTKE